MELNDSNTGSTLPAQTVDILFYLSLMWGFFGMHMRQVSTSHLAWWTCGYGRAPILKMRFYWPILLYPSHGLFEISGIMHMDQPTVILNVSLKPWGPTGKSSRIARLVQFSYIYQLRGVYRGVYPPKSLEQDPPAAAPPLLFPSHPYRPSSVLSLCTLIHFWAKYDHSTKALFLVQTVWK